MIIEIKKEMIEESGRIQQWCKLPYKGNPDGCSKYGVGEGCPPKPLLSQIIYGNNKMYVVYTEFDIRRYGKDDWETQAKKIHAEEVEKFKKEYGIERIISCPHAYGVNVAKMMKKVGIEFEWPPKNKLRLISMGLEGKLES
jgi:hypothetical protein